MLIFDPCLHSIRFILFEEKNSIEGALLVLLFETIWFRIISERIFLEYPLKKEFDIYLPTILFPIYKHINKWLYS